MRLSLLILTSLVATCAVAESNVQYGSPPGWIQEPAAGFMQPTPQADLTYGYDYLLVDRQVNIAEQTSYHHLVYRITAESSLQSGSSLQWDFDPAYETFSLHQLHVVRDGEVHDRLNPATVKVIQQERDLDRHMLNGDLTALVVLDDIRVGDVIDYSFTRKGWNPTFNNQLFSSVSAASRVPVRYQRLRILVPPGRQLHFRPHGNVTLQLTKTVVGEETCFTWEEKDRRPVEVESEVPDWFDAVAFLQLGEFDGWGDVVRWAEPLYENEGAIAESVTTQAVALTQGAVTAEAKAIALLNFVQQEVRYLGMELGAGSYRPRPPAEVLARRFGDCKDKVVLFCSMMRAVGLTAYPALVNTDDDGRVDRWLPSPGAFDHVIACIEEGKTKTWVDPTLSYQQGELRSRGIPTYGRALLIKPGETALTEIDFPETARSTVRIEERFDIPDFEQPAGFTVTTRNTGLSADSIRRLLAQKNPDQLMKEYVNYYASAYPGITGAGRITWTDDQQDNVVTVVESYLVPNLWHAVGDSRKLKAEFYPKSITDYAVVPKATVRTMPLAVSYPVQVKLTTEVHLPEDWSVTPEEVVFKEEAFVATTSISGTGKTVLMEYSWNTKADHVAADGVAKHLEVLRRFRDSLGYNLTYTKPVAAPAQTTSSAPSPTGFVLNWRMVLINLTVFGLVGYFGVGLNRVHPVATGPAMPVDAHLCGLGGWLILVGIGLVVRPISLLFQVVTTLKNTFDQNIWESVTHVGGAGYRAGLGPLIAAESIGNAILVSGSVVMLVLFFGRRRAFPKVFVAMILFNVVFVVVDEWLSRYFVVDASKTAALSPGLIRMLGQAALWIPYMYLSRRVRATFVR